MEIQLISICCFGNEKECCLRRRGFTVYWNMPSGLTKAGEVDDLSPWFQ